MRSEAEIFEELEVLCTKPGYVYVLAHLAVRDSFIRYQPEEITSDDVYRSYNPSKLIRTELSTLAGLAVKGEFKIVLISPEEILQLTKQTDHLMKELHEVLSSSFKGVNLAGNPIHPVENPFKKAKAMREPIFYTAEAAYPFQYKEFSSLRYIQDNGWLQKHMGFCIQDVQNVTETILKIRSKKIEKMKDKTHIGIPVESAQFHVFTFTLNEVEKQSNCFPQTVKNIISAFCLSSQPCNKNFNGIGDFNEITARPIIKINKDEYLLLQSTNLIESIYESPFYWMIKDEKYEDTASKHRGDFTEQFCLDRLKCIFGEKNVYKNVKFEKDKGEIDVLVTYSDRAIVFQAKSKKLTLEARKGNDKALKTDFQAAIQDAYDQGFRCAELLNNKDFKTIDINKNLLEVRRDFREIYIITIISENYPSLAFQVEQFLKYTATETIPPPFVMDVFFLDTLCEFIKNPLYFLDFIQKRIKYFDKIILSNEFAILSNHLKYNLFIPDDNYVSYIDYDFCANLDRAMYVRRENLPGNPNIEGILTRLKEHTFGKLIQHISQYEQDGILDLGFLLLNLSENTAKSLGDGMEEMIYRSRTDKKLHDFSHKIGESAGLTFYTSYSLETNIIEKLYAHCKLKKYKEKFDIWFGLAKNVNSNSPFDIGLIIDEPWEHSDKMECWVKKILNNKPFHDLQTALHYSKKKIGRNESCFCGSGKKYKKCHGKSI